MEFHEIAAFPLSAEKFCRWSFLGGTSWLAILSLSLFWEPNPRWNSLGGGGSLLFPSFWGKKTWWDQDGWDVLAGNSLLSFLLGKNCLGGLTWLEIVGIFLPQQDLPGWSFVTGNSLVSHCLVASYFGLSAVLCLGGVSVASWLCLRCVLVVSIGGVPVVYRLSLGCVFTAFWSCLGCVLVVSWW